MIVRCLYLYCCSRGFDHAVLMALGLGLDVDRTLLHGVGCAGRFGPFYFAWQSSAYFDSFARSLQAAYRHSV